MRKDESRALHRVRSPTSRLIDCGRKIRKLPNGVECHFVENARLVIVDNEDSSRRKDHEEGVQVVRVGFRKPRHCKIGRATSRGGQNFKCRDRRAIAATLPTDNQDGPISHDHNTRVPTTILFKHKEIEISDFVKLTNLQSQFFCILFPVCSTVDSGRTTGSVQPDTES